MSAEQEAADRAAEGMTWPIPRAEYEEVLRDLQYALSQPKPDGRGCVVCHDSGHQAFECGHNPVVQRRRLALLAEAAGEIHDWLHEITEAAKVKPLTAVSICSDAGINRPERPEDAERLIKNLIEGSTRSVREEAK